MTDSTKILLSKVNKNETSDSMPCLNFTAPIDGNSKNEYNKNNNNI